MEKYTQFKTVTNGNEVEFNNAVVRHLKEGWLLLGGTGITQSKVNSNGGINAANSKDGIVYVQALVKL